MNNISFNNLHARSETNLWAIAKWPQILMAQHNQLDAEMNAIDTMLCSELCSLFQLDAKLKKFTQGLLTHLQLEDFFITPMLENSSVSEQQKKRLKRGYKSLMVTCSDTVEYVHALKLEHGNGFINTEHGFHISKYLVEINQRLDDEDEIYLNMHFI